MQEVKKYRLFKDLSNEEQIVVDGNAVYNTLVNTLILVEDDNTGRYGVELVETDELDIRRFNYDLVIQLIEIPEELLNSLEEDKSKDFIFGTGNVGVLEFLALQLKDLACYILEGGMKHYTHLLIPGNFKIYDNVEDIPKLKRYIDAA